MLGERPPQCKPAGRCFHRVKTNVDYGIQMYTIAVIWAVRTMVMSGKSIPLSVRVSDDDAEFLAALQIDGAVTPSEKLRALIARARGEATEGRSFEASLARLRAQLEPTAQLLRTREMEQRGRSQLVIEVMQALPDLGALLVAGPPPAARSKSEDLIAFERSVADRVFRLMEAILRLAVTEKAPCYNPDVVTQGAVGTLELSRVILSTRLRPQPGSEA